MIYCVEGLLKSKNTPEANCPESQPSLISFCFFLLNHDQLTVRLENQFVSHKKVLFIDRNIDSLA